MVEKITLNPATAENVEEMLRHAEPDDGQPFATATFDDNWYAELRVVVPQALLDGDDTNSWAHVQILLYDDEGRMIAETQSDSPFGRWDFKPQEEWHQIEVLRQHEVHVYHTVEIIRNVSATDADAADRIIRDACTTDTQLREASCNGMQVNNMTVTIAYSKVKETNPGNFEVTCRVVIEHDTTQDAICEEDVHKSYDAMREVLREAGDNGSVPWRTIALECDVTTMLTSPRYAIRVQERASENDPWVNVTNVPAPKTLMSRRVSAVTEFMSLNAMAILADRKTNYETRLVLVDLSSDGEPIAETYA